MKQDIKLIFFKKSDRSSKTFWSPDKVNRLIELHPSHQNSEIAQILGISINSIENKAFSLGLKKPKAFIKSIPRKANAGSFKKGATVWNKGMKGLQIGGIETRFKKGGKHHTSKPIGTIRLNFRLNKPSDKVYLEIKVAESTWITYARYVFIQYYGEVPLGMLIRHKNNNPFDNRLENLECVSKKRNRLLNSGGTTLADGYIVNTLIGKSVRDGSERTRLKRIFSKRPDLIELKRNLLILKRQCKS